jgi:putative SbcD/Mre11-related phosphoesterase
MRAEPVPDVPALLLKGHGKWVCVADLHMGIEVQLRRAGFNIPSQSGKMLSALEQLASHGDGLVMLGDIKHRIPGLSHRENKEIPPLMSRLTELFKEIVLVAGNHDGGLASALPESVKAVPGGGMAIEDLGLCHGHVWPSKSAMDGGTLVMGHVHPAVLLVDSIGSKTSEKCWARGKLRKEIVLQRYERCPEELIIVPAFNPLLTGTPVNSIRRAYLGPILRNGLLDDSTLNVYLLDGTNLGHMPPI